MTILRQVIRQILAESSDDSDLLAFANSSFDAEQVAFSVVNTVVSELRNGFGFNSTYAHGKMYQAWNGIFDSLTYDGAAAYALAKALREFFETSWKRKDFDVDTHDLLDLAEQALDQAVSGLFYFHPEALAQFVAAGKADNDHRMLYYLKRVHFFEGRDNVKPW